MQQLYNFRSWCIALILLSFQLGLRAQNARPRIGLTLSGGGAKGLAHIGLLKAIDSAGLQIDYVTGTSMGAVIGSAYAAGYSGKEIDSLFRQLDWQTILSNHPAKGTANLRESNEAGHYLELPLKKGKLSFNRGIIESNELWLSLAEVFFPYYGITDFRDFDKGFQCMATDIATGELVVIERGNIVDAVRASMAIPSVFTSVEIDGRMLMDGGIRRNFPASNAKQMGADIVIGSDVSGQLKPADQIVSPLDVISRLPFYDAVSDLQEQKKFVDLYIDYDLGGFGTSSFAAASQIMAIGDRRASELYASVKKLKDSLDAIYGVRPMRPKPQRTESVFIDGYEIRGLSESEKQTFMRLMDFESGRQYNAKQISGLIKTVFATKLYAKINYRLEPTEGQSAKIVFDVVKSPPVKALFGVHYNSTTGIALKVGSEKRGFLNPLSTASCIVAVGENTRGVATFTSYLNKKRNLLWQAEANFCILDLNTYDADYAQNGLYDQATQDSDVQLVWQPKSNWSLGIGVTLSNVSYTPRLTSGLQADGSIAYNMGYFFVHHKTLDADVYPSRGRRLLLKAGIVFNQKPDYSIYYNETLIANQNSPFFNFDPYQQLRLDFQQYLPVGRHAVFADLQAGMNFNYEQLIMNDFMVGGLNNVIRNQITFAGLPEASIFCASAASLKIGFQYSLMRNLYLKPQVNGLVYDFIPGNLGRTSTGKAFGCSMTFAYKTLLGPIEASTMYSNLNNTILPYFNLGYVLEL